MSQRHKCLHIYIFSWGSFINLFIRFCSCYLLYSLFLDPHVKPEGSYKFMLVPPCCRASRNQCCLKSAHYFLYFTQLKKADKNRILRDILFCTKMGFLFWDFFAFFERFCHNFFPGNNLKLKIRLLFIFQTFYRSEYWCSHYGPKCSWPIRLQYSLKFSIS